LDSLRNIIRYSQSNKQQTDMKPFIVPVALAAVIVLAGYTAARADTTATVSATITIQGVSVSVAPGTIAYGMQTSNSATGTIYSAQTQTVTNNGNIAEDFNTRGQSSSAWFLSTTSTGSDQYEHRFCTSTCATPPTNYSFLAPASYASMANNVAALGTTSLDLYINTPNPSTVFTSQSVDVTVQAVAH
jgi:hypothetical protein